MSAQSSSKRHAPQANDKPVKRTRVSRACDQCRIAREKCNGTQPICSTCSTSRRACTYTASVKKRGIQPGYIRALELALAYLFQHNPENENLVNEELAQSSSSSLFLSRESTESKTLYKRWRKARFYTEVDTLLSGGEPSRHDQSELLSDDSDVEKLKTEDPSSVATVETQEQIWAHPLPVLPRASSGQASTPQQLFMSQDLNTRMPLDSWWLIEVYFTYTQSWLPIGEKNTILKMSYSYPMEGIALEPSMSDSGLHAELWSVLAVASSTSSQQQVPSVPTAQLYGTARSLVPKETGNYTLGHVKALLNLAVVDIGRSDLKAAWLLVGHASRILEILDPAVLVFDARHEHVFHSCFILDSILGMSLDHCPHFKAEDATRHGNIDEDGLDEWQPWNGSSDTTLGRQSGTPTLAFSTQNALRGILGIYHDCTASIQEKTERLETWKSSLPPKLAFVHRTGTTTPLTPSATLLQMTYYCVSLSLSFSETWISRLLGLLERAQASVGLTNLPPTIHCLLEFVHKHTATVSLGPINESRLNRIRAAGRDNWQDTRQSLAPTTRTLQSANALQTPTPSSSQQNVYQQMFEADASASTTFALRGQTSGNILPSFISTHSVGRTADTQADHRFSPMPSELESFFDELATLDSANNLDNQPQFMQNLGFAPDANMADLFSEYIPVSTTFMSQGPGTAINLDHYGFYDGG
ncbi:hypothetical protein DE146DRAFT_477383 [Phaeosphaeria sp. MPI-PUGE-AT-0046c]|nr:hypothetical protein DE146DRAFT_477383 [Phaeosphaeria sp. MPI-PUGE-AT-0046c]